MSFIVDLLTNDNDKAEQTIEACVYKAFQPDAMRLLSRSPIHLPA
jgi:hypothetical protein